MTGFTNDTNPTREEVKSAIDTMGACYLGSLCKDLSTHLICANTMRKGKMLLMICSDKFRAASLWNGKLKVVRVEWLFACLQQWKRVNEDDYSMSESFDKDEDESYSGLQEEDQIIVDNLLTTDPSY